MPCDKVDRDVQPSTFLKDKASWRWKLTLRKDKGTKEKQDLSSAEVPPTIYKNQTKEPTEAANLHCLNNFPENGKRTSVGFQETGVETLSGRIFVHSPATSTLAQQNLKSTSNESQSGNIFYGVRLTVSRRDVNGEIGPSTECFVKRGSTGAGFTLSGSFPTYISTIERGSPAEKAGLLEDDILICIDGVSCTELQHAEVAYQMKTALALRRNRYGMVLEQDAVTRSNLHDQTEQTLPTSPPSTEATQALSSASHSIPSSLTSTFCPAEAAAAMETGSVKKSSVSLSSSNMQADLFTVYESEKRSATIENNSDSGLISLEKKEKRHVKGVVGRYIDTNAAASISHKSLDDPFQSVQVLDQPEGFTDTISKQAREIQLRALALRSKNAKRESVFHSLSKKAPKIDTEDPLMAAVRSENEARLAAAHTVDTSVANDNPSCIPVVHGDRLAFQALLEEIGQTKDDNPSRHVFGFEEELDVASTEDMVASINSSSYMSSGPKTASEVDCAEKSHPSLVPTLHSKYAESDSHHFDHASVDASKNMENIMHGSYDLLDAWLKNCDHEPIPGVGKVYDHHDARYPQGTEVCHSHDDPLNPVGAENNVVLVGYRRKTSAVVSSSASPIPTRRNLHHSINLLNHNSSSTPPPSVPDDWISNSQHDSRLKRSNSLSLLIPSPNQTNRLSTRAPSDPGALLHVTPNRSNLRQSQTSTGISFQQDVKKKRVRWGRNVTLPSNAQGLRHSACVGAGTFIQEGFRQRADGHSPVPKHTFSNRSFATVTPVKRQPIQSLNIGTKSPGKPPLPTSEDSMPCVRVREDDVYITVEPHILDNIATSESLTSNNRNDQVEHDKSIQPLLSSENDLSQADEILGFSEHDIECETSTDTNNTESFFQDASDLTTPHNNSSTASIYANIPGIYRTEVKEISWNVHLPKYCPNKFTASSVLLAKDADPEDPTMLMFNKSANACKHGVERQSFIGTYQVVAGRTGIEGRGVLKRWGPNHTTRLLITRFCRDQRGKLVIHRGGQLLEVLVILNSDGKYDLPSDEQDLAAFLSSLQRQSNQGLQRLKSQQDRASALNLDVDELSMRISSLLGTKAQGIVQDDARNTDNAWVEMTATNIHDNGTAFCILSPSFSLEFANYNAHVQWVKIHQSLAFRNRIFKDSAAAVCTQRAAYLPESHSDPFCYCLLTHDLASEHTFTLPRLRPTSPKSTESNPMESEDIMRRLDCLSMQPSNEQSSALECLPKVDNDNASMLNESSNSNINMPLWLQEVLEKKKQRISTPPTYEEKSFNKSDEASKPSWLIDLQQRRKQQESQRHQNHGQEGTSHQQHSQESAYGQYPEVNEGLVRSNSVSARRRIFERPSHS